MEKIYLGEYGGHQYYMADKVYNNLDWWEATALAEQLGGKLPIPAEVKALTGGIILQLADSRWEEFDFWHGGYYPNNMAYTIPLVENSELFKAGEIPDVIRASKEDKVDTLILFKTPIEENKEDLPLFHAKHFLKKALEVQDSRASEYDTDEEEERNMGKIVTSFNAITGHTLTEAEGYLFMETLKNVRLFGAPSFHEDSAVDGISYASLKAEAKAKEV